MLLEFFICCRIRARKNTKPNYIVSTWVSHLLQENLEKKLGIYDILQHGAQIKLIRLACRLPKKYIVFFLFYFIFLKDLFSIFFITATHHPRIILKLSDELSLLQAIPAFQSVCRSFDTGHNR